MGKVPYQSRAASVFGTKGAVITPGNEDLSVVAKAIVCLSDGDVTIIPAANDDADTITFTGCSVGFIPPYKVRRVVAATGQWASVLG